MLSLDYFVSEYPIVAPKSVRIYCISQVSVLNDDAGNPSVLNRSPIMKSLKAYLTETGSFTAGENKVIPELVMNASAGKNRLFEPAISKHERSFPYEVSPFGELSNESLT